MDLLKQVSVRIAVFQAVWDELAEKGKCSDRGGAEYIRVLVAWTREGFPETIRDFIVNEVKRPPFDMDKEAGHE